MKTASTSIALHEQPAFLSSTLRKHNTTRAGQETKPLSTEATITKVEHLRSLLSAQATSDVYEYEPEDYSNIRRELLADPRLKQYVPAFIRKCRNLSDFWQFIKLEVAYYPEYALDALRRQFIRDQFDPLLSALEDELLGSPSDKAHSAVLAKVDSAHVHDAWQRALERRGSDPAGAITSARTLLEAVCKHILDEANVPVEDKWDLSKLYGKAAAVLNLAPSQHDEQVFKQVLGGCQSVVNGLAAMRNALGDAHGKGRRVVTPLPRHAELGVNLAGATAVFLIRTWEERAKSQSGKWAYVAENP